MKLSSTEFRKDLFKICERALRGESVEVLHKGRSLRLVPSEKLTKISRLVQRQTINGTPEDLEHAVERRSRRSMGEQMGLGN
jgi:antitoxin (DNA-binding transcriptional repressor) of toxin-antitoxin stability system